MTTSLNKNYYDIAMLSKKKWQSCHFIFRGKKYNLKNTRLHLWGAKTINYSHNKTRNIYLKLLCVFLQKKTSYENVQKRCYRNDKNNNFDWPANFLLLLLLRLLYQIKTSINDILIILIVLFYLIVLYEGCVKHKCTN